jgi:hypothetical protein
VDKQGLEQKNYELGVEKERLEQRNQGLDSDKQRLELKNRELEADKQEFELKTQELNIQNANLQENILNLRQQLNAMVNSRSYRITKPLRKIMTFIQKAKSIT